MLLVDSKQNQDEVIEAVFVHGVNQGKVWISGLVNWARARRFNLPHVLTMTVSSGKN